MKTVPTRNNKTPPPPEKDPKDFRWKNLRGRNLTGANLSRMDLTRADLSHAKLSKADLSGSRLVAANLSHADLTETDLSDADLTGADLTGVHPRKTRFKGANLRGALMDRASFESCSFEKARLAGNNLKSVVFIASHFLQADLRGVSAPRASFAGCSFDKADLEGMDLTEADLQNASVKFADFSGACLAGACLKNVDFHEAMVQGAVFSAAYGLSRHQRALLQNKGGNTGAGFLSKTKQLVHAFFPPIEKTKAPPQRIQRGDRHAPPAKRAGKNLVRSDFSKSRLEQVDLQKACLTGSDFSKAEFLKTDLSGATMIGVSLKAARLRQVRMESTALDGADLKTAEKCMVRKAAAAGNDWKFAEFRKTDFSGTNFTGTNLMGVSFANCVLKEALFRGADLSGALLVDCSVDGADFSAADLRNARLINTDFARARVEKARFWFSRGLSSEQKSSIEARGGSLYHPFVREIRMLARLIASSRPAKVALLALCLGVAWQIQWYLSNPRHRGHAYLSKTAWTAEKQRDYSKALRLYQILDDRNREEGYVDIGLKQTKAGIYRRQKQFDRALAIYHSLQRLPLKNDQAAAVLQAVADTYWEMGQFQEAAKNYQSILDRFPRLKNPSVLFNARTRLIDIKRRQGMQKEVVKDYQDLLPLHKDDPEKLTFLHDAIGNVYWDMGQFQGAAKHFRIVIDRFPSSRTPWIHFNARTRLIELQRRQGKQKEALKAYQDLLPLYKDDPERLASLHDAIADVYWNMGQFQEAAERYQFILDRFPNCNNPWPLFNARMRLIDIQHKNNPLETLRAYQALLPSYESSPEQLAQIYGNISQTHLGLRNFQEAEKYSRLILSRFPDLKNPWLIFSSRTRLIELQRRQGKQKESLKACQDLLPLYKDDPERLASLHDTIANIHWDMGQFQEAAERYQFILDRFPNCDNPWPLFNARMRLIELQRRHGKQKEALKSYRDLLPLYRGQTDKLTEIRENIAQCQKEIEDISTKTNSP